MAIIEKEDGVVKITLSEEAAGLLALALEEYVDEHQLTLLDDSVHLFRFIQWCIEEPVSHAKLW